MTKSFRSVTLCLLTVLPLTTSTTSPHCLIQKTMPQCFNDTMVLHKAILLPNSSHHATPAISTVDLYQSQTISFVVFYRHSLSISINSR
ncbi:hypothetical protein HDK77DRAFT_433060 [Phyllosticta capitalensis]